MVWNTQNLLAASPAADSSYSTLPDGALQGHTPHTEYNWLTFCSSRWKSVTVCFIFYPLLLWGIGAVCIFCAITNKLFRNASFSFTNWDLLVPFIAQPQFPQVIDAVLYQRNAPPFNSIYLTIDAYLAAPLLFVFINWPRHRKNQRLAATSRIGFDIVINVVFLILLMVLTSRLSTADHASNYLTSAIKKNILTGSGWMIVVAPASCAVVSTNIVAEIQDMHPS